MAEDKFPEKIKKNIDRVLDLMKSNKLPEAVAKIVFPSTGKPISAWSISNKLICFTDWIYTHYEKEMSSATTPEERGIIFMRALPEAIEKADYRGFKQWNDIKRNVKKGQVATGYILAPMFRKGTSKYVTIDGKKVRVYKGDEPKYKPEDLKTEEFRFIFGFRGVPTFDVLQTDGKAVEYKELKLPQLPFKPVADFLGIKVIPQSFSGNAYGSFSPQAKLITLATPDEGTFLHELSHAVDDYIMKETTGKGLKGGQHADQELVAEFSSAVLLAILGKKIEEKTAYTKRYVQGYTGKTEGYEEDLIQLMSRIEKVVDFISNFKQAESPNRQAEKQEGEPADKVEKLANNPPKPTKAEETKRVKEAEKSADKVGAIVGTSSGGEKVTILTATHKSIDDKPKEEMSDLDKTIKEKFKNYSDKRLVQRINSRFKAGKNDDDEVHELFRRKKEQGFEVEVGFDTYTIKEKSK